MTLMIMITQSQNPSNFVWI